MDLAAAAGIQRADPEKDLPADALIEILRKAHAYARRVLIFTPGEVRFGPPERVPERIEIEAALGIAGGRLRKDCDGFAALCREVLNDIGVASRLLYCQTEEPPPNGHLVTEVSGWVLDCRRSIVMPRDMLPYRWLKISGEKPGEPWKEITA